MNRIILIIVTSLIVRCVLFAQGDTLFMDQYWNKTQKINAHTYWLIEEKNGNKEIKEYDLLGKLILQNEFNENENELNIVVFDDFGRNSISGKIKNGMLEGTWFYYNEKGDILKQLNYNNTVLVDTTLDFNEMMSKFKFVEDMPTFQGGDISTFSSYLHKEFTCPYLPKRFGIKGKFFIQFIINKDGQMVNLNIKRSIHPQIDQEIKRIIATAPNWRPAKHNRKLIEIPITVPFEIE